MAINNGQFISKNDSGRLGSRRPSGLRFEIADNDYMNGSMILKLYKRSNHIERSEPQFDPGQLHQHDHFRPFSRRLMQVADDEISGSIDQGV